MSGTVSETASSTVSRTKEGIPTWSGEANSFVQYEEAALLWEQSLTWEKRYTAGPRLVQELTGAARRLVAGQPAGWVAFRGGVTLLMDHLRQALGKPRVNEVTDLLAAYFKGTRRKNSESMNDYITRKFEAYMRASQAMKRVAPHYEAREPSGGSRSWNRRSSEDYSQWGGRSDASEPRDTAEADGAATEKGTSTTEGPATCRAGAAMVVPGLAAGGEDHGHSPAGTGTGPHRLRRRAQWAKALEAWSSFPHSSRDGTCWQMRGWTTMSGTS